MSRSYARSLPPLIATTVAVLAMGSPLQGAAQAQPAPQSKPAPKAPRQCFNANNVNSFAPVDDTHVNLRVGVKEVYQLTLFAPCRDIDWTWSLGVRTRSGGSFICSGLDAEIIVPDRNFPQRCLVSGIRRLSPDELKTAPSRQRP
jgi:hypothetical protein